MARNKKTQASVEKALNEIDQPERFKLGEIGYSGLSIFNGVTNEEAKKELNWPASAETYKEMSYHTAVNACLSLYDNLISKVTWRVVPPKEATEQEKNEAKFIDSCLKDMEHSLREFIKDALSSNIYGFSVHEKVYRRRYKSNGSLYDDGRIGIKKIALRNQETIQRFIFDNNGNEIIGVEQNVDSYLGTRYGSRKSLNVVLPRSKYVHITVGRDRNDPFGKSPLRDVYLAWRYITVIQEIEAAGVARDLQGLPVLEIPAQYMSADATADQKAIYENFKTIVRNIQTNSQSGIILPSAVDPETKQKLFSLSLLSGDGKKSFDTTQVKQYYQNQIFTGLHADVLQLGQGGVGSFALGQIKNSLTGSAVETMLDNIVEEFNRDVIRQLYELNGLDFSRACRLDYEGLTATDLDTLSKAYQRLASTSMIEKDREVLNAIRKSLSIDPKPDDEPVDEKLLTPNTSRASDGLEVGRTGNGTATTISGEDTSSNNLENAA